MSNYLRGQDINIGFAIEDPENRGDFKEPQIWLPARTPTGFIAQPEMVELQETVLSGMNARGSEITRYGIEGEVEYNVRAISVGFILKSWLGEHTVSGLGGGAYEHTFTLKKKDPIHPSLSTAISQCDGGHNHYEAPKTVVQTFNLVIPVDDLVNATSNFMAPRDYKKEGDKFESEITENDHYFRHQDVKIKMAENEGDLDSADAISVKTFEPSGNNNASFNQNISELAPGEVKAGLMEMNIEFTSDYLDDTYRDMILNGEVKAMRVEMEREDIDIGDGEHPKMVITYPKVKLASRTQDRPMEDTVIDNCSARVFEAPVVKVVNEKENYEHNA